MAALISIRNIKRLCPLALWAALAAAICGCGDLGQYTGGGGTETVVGAVINEDGESAANTMVELLPSDFNPLAPSVLRYKTRVMTDDSGVYIFNNVPQGDYTLQAVRQNSGTRVLRTGISVAQENVTNLLDTLHGTGTVIVDLPDDIDPVTGYVYIPGTGMAALSDESGGSVTLDSVPAGTIPAIFGGTKNDQRAIRYRVLVLQADTTMVKNPAWDYARQLRLNTASSGAQVNGDVGDFPVLIRLTKDNFNFAEAQARGEDIRFRKSDDSPMPCEIERWDAGNNVAEIWVRVDTVYGGNDVQSLTMYWGNPNTAGGSIGAAVFDTAAGFAGVWHLGESGDSVYDATGNGFNGKDSGCTAAAGIIGNARNFKDGNYIRISGLCKSPSDITLSAWVRSDTSKKGQDVISVGDAVLIRLDDVLGMGTSGCYHDTAFISDSSYATVTTGRYLAKTGWHYVAFSINTVTHAQTLYIDGVSSAIATDVNPINYAGLGTDIYIGKHGNGKTFYFFGQIDEVRVSNMAVNPDWIKLCFMNQKVQDALVQW